MKDILDESDHNKKPEEQKINQLLWILKGILNTRNIAGFKTAKL